MRCIFSICIENKEDKLLRFNLALHLNEVVLCRIFFAAWRVHRTAPSVPGVQLGAPHRSVSLLPRWHGANSSYLLAPPHPGCRRGSHPATPPFTPLPTQPPATPPPLPPNKPPALGDLANLLDSHAEVQKSGGEERRHEGGGAPFFSIVFLFLSSPLPRPSFPSLHRRTLK